LEGTVRGFPDKGIQLQLGNVLAEDLVVEDNGGHGINVGAGSIVRNVAALNNETGIVFASPSLVTDSLAIGNNVGFFVGAGTTPGSTIRHCVARDNSLRGIYVAAGGSNRIEGNHVSNNGVGFFVYSTANVIIRNTATGNGTNYDIYPGNDVGPIGSAATATSPWANISN